jgi:hypothetical protein
MVNDSAREGIESVQLNVRDITNPTAGSGAIGTALIKDDGTGRYWIRDDRTPASPEQLVSEGLSLDDDVDKDGIPPTTETQLATLVASQGVGTAQIGDLNGDGKADAEQSAMATLAWIKAEYFDDGLSGVLTKLAPIISLSATRDNGNGTEIADDANYQVQDIKVTKASDLDVLAVNAITADGLEFETRWDPLQFKVARSSGNSTSSTLADIDPLRPGIQVTIAIDISRSGLTTADVNSYMKWVSNDAITASNNSLLDLNGKLITRAGWYEFMQRKNSLGEYIGDGARFVLAADGLTIREIRLTLTDNAFGDNEAQADLIYDPGFPVFIPPAATQPPPSIDLGLPPSERPLTWPIRPGADPERDSTTNPDRGPAYEPADGGSGGLSPLDLQRIQQARDALIAWARQNGLVDQSLGRSTSATQGVDAAAGVDDQASKTRAPSLVAAPGSLSDLGPNLLQALVLGAAGLYLTQELGQRSLEQLARQWVGRWLPRPKVLAAAGWHRTVISVFVVQGSRLQSRLVAAQVLEDAVEILAEQPLRLEVPAGTPWDQLDLEQALTRLVEALEEQSRDHQALLLLDPLLQEHLPVVQHLATDQALLRHPGLDGVLKALSEEEQEHIRRWLNHPSQTTWLDSEGCARLKDQLQGLQRHWSDTMPESMANVTAVLELSIALGNHQPDHALI